MLDREAFLSYATIAITIKKVVASDFPMLLTIRPLLLFAIYFNPKTMTNRQTGFLSDRYIRSFAEEGMITPFEYDKVRKIKFDSWDLSQTGLYRDPRTGLVNKCSAPAISFGCSSYGYDLRLAPHDFRIFHHVPGLIVNPKAFDDRCLVSTELYADGFGEYFILPAHTYALGVTLERLKLPPNITALFIGKSTYARCGIIVNTTPGEAGWEGFLTLEISNSSGADCRIYANEGIAQALFMEGSVCDNPYGEGKYQDQGNVVTLARI